MAATPSPRAAASSAQPRAPLAPASAASPPESADAWMPVPDDSKPDLQDRVGAAPEHVFVPLPPLAAKAPRTPPR